jgi:hypothetical protein
MNTNKKFGLKKASQMRDLSEFTKDELDAINSIKSEVVEGDNKESFHNSQLDENNELIVNKS